MSNEREKDVGFGYRSTYKDKQGREQTYLKLYIRPEEFDRISLSKTGMKNLVIFPLQVREADKKDNTPDYVVKEAKGKSRGGNGTRSTSNRTPF